MDSDSDEEHELDAKEPGVKSDSEALKLTDMLLEYSRYHGREAFHWSSSAISKVDDLFQISISFRH